MTREEYEVKKEELLEEIKQAFGGVERDEEVVAWVKNLSAYNTSDKEQLLGMGNRWQDVPNQWIQENHSFLFYLDAPSFRFYLPAYLRWFLSFMDYEAESFWSLTFGVVLHSLSISDRSAEFSLKKYSLLTPVHKESRRSLPCFPVRAIRLSL